MNGRTFEGFPDGRVKQCGIPEVFFTDVLPGIDDLEELKTALYAFWFFERQEGKYRYLTLDHLLSDPAWLMHLEGKDIGAREAAGSALAACCRDGILVDAVPKGLDVESTIYFLNNARGRAAAKACQEGQWSPEASAQLPVQLADARPNIFQLYEQNIGPLTPIIADELIDAEKTYSQEWIEEAIRIAVENNARRWIYILTILRSWKEKGKHAKDQRTAQKDRKKYIQGEYGDLIEH